MDLNVSPAYLALFFGGKGRDGKPVERTRQDYPYSFDDYLSYENTAQPLANNSMYTDRMYEHEPKKYKELMQKHFQSESEFWGGRSPEKIEAFLRDYCDLPSLQLVRIWTCCNQAYGSEHWQFEFLDETFPLPEGYRPPVAKKGKRKKAAAR
jgi:hypothetical protein